MTKANSTKSGARISAVPRTTFPDRTGRQLPNCPGWLTPSSTPAAGYLHHSIVKSHSHASVLSPHPKTVGRVKKEIPSPTLTSCVGCGCVCRPMLCSNKIKSEETQTLSQAQPARTGRSPTPAFRRRSPSSFSPPGRPLPRGAHARPLIDLLPPDPPHLNH